MLPSRRVSRGGLGGLPGISPPLTLLLLVSFLTIFTLGRWSAHYGAKIEKFTTTQREPFDSLAKPEGQQGRTLITYIFSDTDAEYVNNLKFFVRWGVRENDGADYIFVLQLAERHRPGNDYPNLPPLPRNARYIYHLNECYDWGTFGWLLRSGEIKIQKYQYFILMNSSVRGPFIPPYVPAGVPWHRLLTQKLTADVKLVGPTINCEGSPFQGNPHGEWRKNPHVQSFVLATDKEGLDILIQDKNVLSCWSDRWDAIWYAELGSSWAVLSAGFNIDSIISRYQGIDWRDQRNWGCNAAVNPTADYNFDGITLGPYDLLFVKFKDTLLHSMSKSPENALKYATWMESQAFSSRDVTTNDFVSNKAKYTQPHISSMLVRGNSCFDFDHYKGRNADLAGMSNPQAWEHFVLAGQFESRPHRFTCEQPVINDLANFKLGL